MQTSDYITHRKQTTFFCTLKQDAKQFQTVNPVKKNQRQYNNKLQVCENGARMGTGVVINAQSYALLQDFRRGKVLLGDVSTPCTPCAF